nr:cobalamin biosynthesis bifunctional protein CbiET [Amaricoccus sp.]
DPARRAMAARNATRLGAPRLALIDGTAPQALSGMPPPDAVFIGGGLDRETVAACLRALRPFGRLVANAVTLESEALLAEMQAEHGGDLTRIAVSRAEPVGRFRGWRPAMPVTQWSFEP